MLCDVRINEFLASALRQEGVRWCYLYVVFDVFSERRNVRGLEHTIVPAYTVIVLMIQFVLFQLI